RSYGRRLSQPVGRRDRRADRSLRPRGRAAREVEGEQMAGASDVICLGCGAEVAADAGHCPRCDTAPEERCEECRQGLWPGFRFCPGCGRPRIPESRVALASSFPSLREQMPAGLAEEVLAARGRIEGEGEEVTVLFCD